MSRPTMTNEPTIDFKRELYNCVNAEVMYFKKVNGCYPFYIEFSNIKIFSNEYWDIIGEYNPEFVRIEKKG